MSASRKLYVSDRLTMGNFGNKTMMSAVRLTANGKGL